MQTKWDKIFDEQHLQGVITDLHHADALCTRQAGGMASVDRTKEIKQILLSSIIRLGNLKKQITGATDDQERSEGQAVPHSTLRQRDTRGQRGELLSPVSVSALLLAETSSTCADPPAEPSPIR